MGKDDLVSSLREPGSEGKERDRQATKRICVITWGYLLLKREV
jgi:hypothetical protein